MRTVVGYTHIPTGGEQLVAKRIRAIMERDFQRAMGELIGSRPGITLFDDNPKPPNRPGMVNIRLVIEILPDGGTDVTENKENHND
jgi:hypothetical protein